MRGKNFLDLVILKFNERNMALEEQLEYIKKLNDDDDANTIFEGVAVTKMHFDDMFDIFEKHLLNDENKKYAVAEIFKQVTKDINSQDCKKNINFTRISYMIRDIIFKIIPLTDDNNHNKLDHYMQIGKQIFKYSNSFAIYRMFVTTIEDIDNTNESLFLELLGHSIEQALKCQSISASKTKKLEQDFQNYIINNCYDLPEEDINVSDFGLNEYASLVKRVINNPANK